jgi:hypothetical protein
MTRLTYVIERMSPPDLRGDEIGGYSAYSTSRNIREVDAPPSVSVVTEESREKELLRIETERLEGTTIVRFLSGRYLVMNGRNVDIITKDSSVALTRAYHLIRRRVKTMRHQGDSIVDRVSNTKQLKLPFREFH